MNTPSFTKERSAAMRSALVDHVGGQPRSATRRRRVATPLLVGLTIVLLGAGGVSAATATGLITWPLLTDNPRPGGLTAHAASSVFEATGAGTAEVDLLAAPEGATHVSVRFTCLSPGTTYTWGLNPNGNNPSSSCAQPDVGTASAGAWFDFPVAPDARTLYIRADAGAPWAVSWVYLSKDETEWAVNAKGDTYGIFKPDGSSPDLVAVVATNGREGYVYADELAEADGTSAVETFKTPEDAVRWQEEMKGKRIAVPVYESDGSTRVAEFVIQH